MGIMVDVSHHNGVVDFQELRGHVAGVIHKAGQGHPSGNRYTDPRYLERSHQAAAAGVPWGAYYMVDPDDDPHAQVYHFLSIVQQGAPVQIRLAGDFELASGSRVQDIAARYGAWADELSHRIGYECLAYTYPAYVRAGYCDQLRDQPLWYADYSGPLTPPAGWRAVLWQIGQRQVAGVSAGDGNGVDVDQVVDASAVMVPRPSAPRPPKPVPLPAPRKEPDVLFTYRKPGRPEQFASDPAGLRYLSSDEWHAINGAGDIIITTEVPLTSPLWTRPVIVPAP